MKDNRILIGIVTYNRKGTLLKSIEAHIADGIDASDIFVVNNNSSDGTEYELRQYYPLVKVFTSKENIGSAGGFAVCMQKANEMNYNYVWLYNDDSRPLLGANALMHECIQDLSKMDANFGLVKMAMLRDGKAEILHWKGRRIPQLISTSPIPIKTDLITFDGCIISTITIREIGTCNPIYFMGMYEFDFCLRARDKNYTIYTLPAGLIEDEKMGSVKGSPYWRMYYNTRNHLYLAIRRKSLKILFGFFESEVKKTYSIVFLQHDKLRKIKYKVKAIFDALLGRMGRRVVPF
jgi:GT2 family glycosyltransferase